MTHSPQPQTLSGQASIGPTSRLRQQIGTFEPIVEQLARDGVRYFGGIITEVDPLSLRVGRFSDLLRVRVRAGDREEHVFIKIFKPQGSTETELASLRAKIQRDYNATARVHERLAERRHSGTVRPIGCFPDQLAMVVEEAPGVTLQHWLARHACWYPKPETLAAGVSAFEHVGGWLRAYQELGTVKEAHVSPESLRTYLQSRLSQLLRNGRFLTSDLEAALLARFDHLIAQVDPGSLRAVPTHGDLSPENVLVHDGVITVLDFTMAKAGNRYLDAAHLHVQLERLLLKPWYRAPVIRQLQTALLRGFEPGLTVGHPLFQLMVLQHWVCRLVQTDFASTSLARRLVMRYVGWRQQQWLIEPTAVLGDRGL